MTSVLIGLSSILWIMSFPVAIQSGNWIPGWLSAVTIWVGLVPLILLIHQTSPKKSFKFGFIFGFIAYLGILHWTMIALSKYGHLPMIESLGILLLLTAAHACFPAIAFWLIAKSRRLGPLWLLGSVIFTLSFWVLSSFPFDGFPWAHPAYALASFTQMIQIADLVGIHGLNFIILLANFVLAQTILSLSPANRTPLPKFGLFFVLSIFFASLFYGSAQIKQRDPAMSHTPHLKVSLLQGNISQETKMTEDNTLQVLSTYRQMSLTALQSSPDLIVWPEAAFPGVISSSTRRIPVLEEATQHSDVLIGAATWSTKNNAIVYSNSAFVLTSNAQVKHRYDKQHLVPFGEYVPYSSLPFVKAIVPSVAGNFTHSDPPESLPTLKGIPYGIMICYEVLFPEIALDMVHQGAQFFVNITNDAWFDITSGPYQHANFGIFRAIETRRPIVRAANTGFTLWYDPLGQTHERAELFHEAIVQATITPATEITFYVTHPYLPTLFLFLLLGAILSGRFKRYA